MELFLNQQKVAIKKSIAETNYFLSSNHLSKEDLLDLKKVSFKSIDALSDLFFDNQDFVLFLAGAKNEIEELINKYLNI